MMRATTRLAVLGCAAVAIMAGAAAGHDADQRVALLAPLIENDTIAVLRLDVAGFDAESVFHYLASLFPDYAGELNRTAASGKQVHKALREAGAGEAVVVFSAPEFPEPSFTFVTMKEGADEAALAKFQGRTSNKAWRVQRLPNGLVAGKAAVIERLTRGKRNARPKLPAALAAAGNAPLQFLLLPSEDHRRVIRELLPISPGLSSVPAKALADGFIWAALAVDIQTNPSLKLTVQAADAEAAKNLADMAQSGLALIGRQVFYGETKSLRETMPEQFDAVAAALKPAVNGSQLTVTISDPAVHKAIAALIVSALDRAGPAVQSISGQNMQRIAIGLHSYADAHQSHFPPTAIRSSDGKPLLSWRVAILPFVGEKALYQQFKLDEPWDSEHNKKLIEKMPAIYQSPKIKDKRPGLTTYLVPVGKEVAFTGEATGRIMPKEFEDGTSNTILLLDVADEKGVTWTKPDDLPVDSADPKNGLIGHFPGFFLVAMADGSVRRVRQTISNKTLWAAFTCSGAETLGPDW
jgi:hypothetical protein